MSIQRQLWIINNYTYNLVSWKMLECLKVYAYRLDRVAEGRMGYCLTFTLSSNHKWLFISTFIWNANSCMSIHSYRPIISLLHYTDYSSFTVYLIEITDVIKHCNSMFSLLHSITEAAEAKICSSIFYRFIFPPSFYSTLLTTFACMHIHSTVQCPEVFT